MKTTLFTNEELKAIGRYTYRGINGKYYLYDRLHSLIPPNTKPQTKKEIIKEAKRRNEEERYG
jgi:hypothetical protein